MKPLASLDVEGTGLNVSTDRIIEIAFILEGEVFETLVNPERPTPPEITEMTGIDDDMVRDAPKFREVAEKVFALCNSHDLIGYNLWGYDLQIIWEELYRAGFDWDWTGVNVIDCGVLFKKKEERNLSAAVRFYCGQDHTGAHRAAADAQATRRVFDGQLARYGDLAVLPREKLSEFAQFDKKVDLAGKFALNETGEVVFNFGQQGVRGTPVRDNTGLLRWMLSKDFNNETKRHARRFLGELGI